MRIKPPKAKEGGGRGQSLLTQVLDKGRFVRLGQTTTLTPGRNVELRCKGSAIGWSYPSSLDTFNDSRLRFLTLFSNESVTLMIHWEPQGSFLRQDMLTLNFS